MAQTLNDNVVLVTGAGSGIGQMIARTFAAQGARVVAADIDEAGAEETARQIEEAGGDVLPLEVDVGTSGSVEHMVRETVRAFGRLDCACNGAGVEGARVPTADYDEAAWDHVMNVNLRGTWLCMKHEIAQMEEGGSIVNVASVFGVRGFARASAYVAADHGVVGLTKAAALEYGNQGIRVNAVCPSFVNAPLQLRTGILTRPEQLKEAIDALPLGRIGEPSEIAEAVLWLSSEAASFVTGQALCVDGGYTAR